MATAAFTCDGCGSPTTYLPAGLTCDVCGRVTPLVPPEDPRERRVRRRPLRPVFDSDVDWAPEIPDELEWQLQCPQCGGGASYAGTLRASWCPFCAAPVAASDVHESGGRLPIDGIIPFAVGAATAHRAVRRWLARAYFAPRGMRLHTRATHYARVYLPMLCVDARLDAEYTFMGGMSYEQGVVRGDVKDIVITAGTMVEQARIDELRPWPLNLLVPYRPEYLAGAFCESYDRSLAEIRELVRGALRTRSWEMGEFAMHEEARDSKVDLGPLVKVTCESSQETYRHILVPVFLVTTRLRDSVRQIVVSGIDGSIRTPQPISWLKVGCFATGVAALAAGLVWVKNALG